MKITMDVALRLLSILAAIALVSPEPACGQSPMGFAFTYQGRLNQSGQPVNSTCNLEFTLWSAAVGGSQIGGTVTVTGVVVVDGLFTVDVDFGGNVFTGFARWLEIAVSCPAGDPFVMLSPRQEITPAPHALALYGLFTRQNTTCPVLIAGFGGNTVAGGVAGATISGGGSSASPNHVAARYGVVAGGEGNQAGLYGVVGGGEGNNASDPHATVGGGLDNLASDEFATVAGGQGNTAGVTGAAVGGGTFNVAGGGWANVAGGFSNSAAGDTSVIGGGLHNDIAAGAQESTIGGGFTNDVDELADWATVSGGRDNLVSATYTTVGGGFLNEATAIDATVAGGRGNTASGVRSVVAGGAANAAAGLSAAVPGGESNAADGDWSFAAGRRAKALDEGTFVWADSTNADFESTGADQFLIRALGGVGIGTTSPLTPLALNARLGGGDVGITQGQIGGTSTMELTTTDALGAQASRLVLRGGGDTPAVEFYRGRRGAEELTMMIDSTGFVGIGTDSPNSELAVAGTIRAQDVLGNGEPNVLVGNDAFLTDINSANTLGIFGFGDDTVGHIKLGGEGPKLSGANFNLGIGRPDPLHPLHMGSGAHCTAGGTWTNASSVVLKENFQDVAPREILARVTALSIQAWNYKSEDDEVRHVGPMAEDFHAAFALGGDDTSIGTIDADGIALAAIQGLHDMIREKEAKIAALNDRLAALETLVADLALKGGDQ